MTPATVDRAARAVHLAVLGGLHTPSDHPLRRGDCDTVLLLGPDEPGFWPAFAASPERADGAPDPLDRWSARVVTALADRLGAVPFLPFGGPPWEPFIAWAAAAGIHPSPVTLLVHARAGLFVSFRGALGFARRLDLPDPAPRPCETCAGAPCRNACPAGALTPDGYDIAACRAHLDTAAGADCMTRGCAVRRACPVGAGRRSDAQSAFHMKAFHPCP